MLMRKAATASTPTMEITQNGNKWKMATKTVLKTVELNFEIGVPFDETTTDGRKAKTTVTMEGNKLITNQIATEPGKKNVKVSVPNKFFTLKSKFYLGLQLPISIQ